MGRIHSWRDGALAFLLTLLEQLPIRRKFPVATLDGCSSSDGFDEFVAVRLIRVSDEFRETELSNEIDIGEVQ
jgi:hypothetical protein